MRFLLQPHSAQQKDTPVASAIIHIFSFCVARAWHVAGVICGLFIPEPQIRRKAFALHTPCTASSTPRMEKCAPRAGFFRRSSWCADLHYQGAKNIACLYNLWIYTDDSPQWGERERDESSLSAARSSGSTHISAAVLLFMPVWVAGGWSGGWVGWKRRKSARMSSWPSAHHWLQTLNCTFLPFLPPHACVCVSQRKREREIASVL